MPVHQWVLMLLSNIVILVFLTVIVVSILTRNRVFLMSFAYRRMIESIDEGFMVVNDDGKVIAKNPSVDRFIRTSTGNAYDINGKNIAHILKNYPEWIAACSSAGNSYTEFELEYQPKDERLPAVCCFKIKVYSTAGGRRIRNRGLDSDWGLQSSAYSRSRKRQRNRTRRRRRRISYKSVSVIIEITEQKAKEKQLLFEVEKNRESLYMTEKQFETVYENISDVCVFVNPNGKVLKSNCAAKELDEKFNGLLPQFLEILSRSHVHNKALGYGQSYTEQIHLVQDDKEMYLDVTASAVVDSSGSFVYEVLCAHDVTELVVGEKKMKKRMEDLENILNAINDAIVMVDRDRNYRFYNSAYNRMFPDLKGWTEGQSERSRKYYYRDGTPIPTENFPTRRIFNGETVNNEVIKSELGAAASYYNISGKPILGSNGIPLYFIITCSDVTGFIQNKMLIEQQQRELYRIEKEKNDALTATISRLQKIRQLTELNSLKDQIIAIVTHDIRSPLSSMITLTEVLAEEALPMDKESREIIDEIRLQTYAVYNMAESMLEWLRTQSSEFLIPETTSPLLTVSTLQRPLVSTAAGLPSPPSLTLVSIKCMKLSPVLRNMQQLHHISAGIKGVELIIDVKEDIHVLADQKMLESVLRNLITNAIKYTGSGGKIVLEAATATVAATKSETGAVYEKKEAVITVSDTGIGIANKKLQYFFDNDEHFHEYQRMPENSTGLGLMICRDLVIKMGGHISVKSSPGYGSSFIIGLRLADPDGNVNIDVDPDVVHTTNDFADGDDAFDNGMDEEEFR